MSKTFKKLILIDRDGTIIENVEHLNREDQVKIIPNSAKAISKMNSEGFAVAIISNQSAIARGLATEDQIKQINSHLISLLEKQGARIDATYFCPHHPENGIEKYKKRCDCRKPNTGMLKEASIKFNVQPKDCFMIGDMTSDIQAGRNFGCNTILVQTGHRGNDKRHEVTPDYVCKDLLSAVEQIVECSNNEKIIDCQALIIAGGLGTRLHPHTKTMPKPMVLVFGKPMLEYIIENLAKQNILNIIISIGYMGQIIKDYFGDGTRWGVNITYVSEKEPLGTGGAVRLCAPLIKKTFFLIYGDLYFDMKLLDLLLFHKQKGGIGTLSIQESSHPHDCDMLELSREQQIVKFLGKPKQGTKFENVANAGIYVFEPTILKYFPNGISMLDKDVLPQVIEKNQKLFAYRAKSEVYDLGTIDRLEKMSLKVQK